MTILISYTGHSTYKIKTDQLLRKSTLFLALRWNRFLSREPPNLPKKTERKTMCMKQQSREKFWTGSCWAVFEEADKTCLVDNTGEELSADVSVCVVCLYKHTHVMLLYAHVHLHTHTYLLMYAYLHPHIHKCSWQSMSLVLCAVPFWNAGNELTFHLGAP